MPAPASATDTDWLAIKRGVSNIRVIGRRSGGKSGDIRERWAIAAPTSALPN
jgi:hypothetical protein